MRILRFFLAAAAVLMAGLFVATVAAPGPLSAFLFDLERARSGLVRKQIDLPGGLRYVYLEGGQGEPLMLLHGFGADKDNFTRVARHLTPHYRVIVPDQIGFGESSHPPQADYTAAAQAERLHALAQALGLQRPHLAGSSMGGQIALSYAARHPAEVGSLWLLAPAGIWRAPPSELARGIAAGGRNRLLAQNADDFVKLYSFVMSDAPYMPRFMKEEMARESIAHYELHGRIFKQLTGDDTLEKSVTGLKLPTLIVWGERDRVLDVGGAPLLQQILPNSQLITLPGVGHLPMIERDERVAADYLRFRAALRPL